MIITKYGHCCLLIEEKGLRILTDPGTYSEGQNEAKNIDLVLITHEHADHFHIDSLKIVLKNNPQAVVVSNAAVGALLKEAGIAYELMGNGESREWQGLVVEAQEGLHADMFPGFPRVANTAFRIGERLFYPGDAFIEPNGPVEILALPVAGPWMKLSEAINYALLVKPKVAFPVHDGILKTPGMVHRMPKAVLSERGIDFETLEEGETREF